MTVPGPDRAEILKVGSLIPIPAAVTELRALDALMGNRRVTVSGYFNDFDALADQAAKLSVSAKGVYFTINEVDPALLARRANRVDPVGRGDSLTSDANILRRRWLPVDIDAVRPSGISSTDVEHEEALALGHVIRDFLLSLGWPAPVLADSGNGSHLLAQIDLPPDDGGLVRACLVALAEQFSTTTVKIDTSVHNPARIWRLYGTVARKGDNTEERPHRVSRLLEVPDIMEVVPIESLRALAASAPKAASASPLKSDATGRRAGRKSKRIDLAAWIETHGLAVSEPKPWQKAGTIWSLEECPWNSEHRNGSAYVGQQPSGAVFGGCHHESCQGKGWSDLRAVFEVPDEKPPSSQPSYGGSEATRIVALLDESDAVLWHTPAADAYLSFTNDGHRETMPLRGRRADLFVRRVYYAETGEALGTQAVTDTLHLLRSRAIFDGPEHEAFVRVGQHGDDFYVDLGDPGWRAVRVTCQGWQIVENPPVFFRRAPGMLPLPIPVRGGSLDQLRPFLNVQDDGDFRLIVTAMVAALWPTGPYVVIIFQGEQGSAKSTNSRVIRALNDPNRAALRAQPRDTRELMIAASNAWMIVIDNLSGLQPWLSDSLCRLATGGGFGTRELYTDDGEILFDAQRPMILNGIDDVATRGDLLDRGLLLLPPAIPPSDRRDERSFWAAFENDAPGIFGALLDALVAARAHLGSVDVEGLPRMADFALRGAAAAPALGWASDEFLLAYEENRNVGHVSAVEGSMVARAVEQLVGADGTWQGTATELLENLTGRLPEAQRKSKNWPKAPRSLTNALRRNAPNLRAVGVEVHFDRGTTRTRSRTITLARIRDEPVVASEESASSAEQDPDSDPADATAQGAEYRPAVASTLFESEWGQMDDSDATDEVAVLGEVAGGGLQANPASRAGSSADAPPARAGSEPTTTPTSSTPCRCPGCIACHGKARVLHERAVLQGDWLEVGLCHYCRRQDGA